MGKTIAIVGVALLGLGNACVDPCETDADCADGVCYVPVDGDESDAFCTASCELGDACGGEGQVCVPYGPGEADGVCLDESQLAPAGDGCTEHRECRSGVCTGVFRPADASPEPAGDDDANGGVDETSPTGATGVCASGCDPEQAPADACANPTDRCLEAAGTFACLPPLGSAPTGTVCEGARDCAGHYCVTALHLPAPVCSEACDDHVDCPSVASRCVALAGGGRTCLPAADLGDPCNDADACESELCVGDNDDDRQCVARCGDGLSCPPGLGCTRETGGALVCLPRTDDRDEGEPCADHRQCDVGLCPSFEGFSTQCARRCADGCAEGRTCWEGASGSPDLCEPEP